MTRTVLILARHAATESNERRPYVLQGRSLDLSLSGLGRRQATALAEALARREPVAIYSSPLKRAAETAEMVAEKHRLDVVRTDAMIEAAIGEWEGLCWQAIEERWPAEKKAFDADPAFDGYLTGENFAQVRDRCVPELEAIAHRHAGGTIIVVGHNVTNRVALAHWMGIPICHARRLPQSNAGYSLVTFTAAGPLVQSINLADHLADLLPD